MTFSTDATVDVSCGVFRVEIEKLKSKNGKHHPHQNHHHRDNDDNKSSKSRISCSVQKLARLHRAPRPYNVYRLRSIHCFRDCICRNKANHYFKPAIWRSTDLDDRADNDGDAADKELPNTDDLAVRTW